MGRRDKVLRRMGKKMRANMMLTRTHTGWLTSEIKPTTLGEVWERSCDNKIPYDNRLDAAREALVLEERHRKQFNVYPCTCCGKYHIGGQR